MRNYRSIRLERGLTQRDIALRSGLPIPLVSRWERGEKTVNTETLLRLLAAVGETRLAQQILDITRSGETT